MLKVNSELLILILGRVLQVIVSLIAIKLSTKYLVPKEIGDLYLIISITGFFGLFLINPIGQYINRKTFQWYEEKNILHVFYVFNFYVLCISFVSLAIVSMLYHVGIANNINILYLIISIGLFIYFNTWNQTIIPMINMLGNRNIFVLLTLATQLLYLIFAYIFVNMFESRGIFWFMGQILSFGLLALVGLLYFIKNIQSIFDIKIAYQMISTSNIKKVLIFSWPISLSALFLWIQTQSYTLIIERSIGSEFLGYFGVGIAISLAISGSFEAIIIQYVYPRMYQSMKEKDNFKEEINILLNIIVPIYFSLSIFVTIFAKYIITILTNVQYHDSYIFLIFGIWIAFFRMSSNMLGNIAHAQMKTKTLILPYVIGASIAVFGVVYATTLIDYNIYIPLVLCISSAVSFVLMYIKMNRLISIEIELKNFYRVLLYSVPFLIPMLLYNYTFGMLFSIILVGVFGLYFIYIIYRISVSNTDNKLIIND